MSKKQNKKFTKLLSLLLVVSLIFPVGGFGFATSAEAATGAETKTVYQETFVNGKGHAKESGNAALTAVTGKTFTGNEDGGALHVTNRSKDFDAVDFSFSDVGMQSGKTYKITVTGYVDSDVTVPAGSQAFLQTVDSYSWLASANFKAGEAFTMTGEYTVGSNANDTRVRVQSNDDGATVPFYIGSIVITEVGSSDDETPAPPTREKAVPFDTITFENGELNGFSGRSGNETLTVTTVENRNTSHSKALKVEGRTQNWHGPTINVAQNIDVGYEYNVSVWVKLISPSSATLQLSTQVGSASPSYNGIASQSVSQNDGWVKLEGTYRFNAVPDEHVTLYIESSNSTASFYIDDVSFEEVSGPIEIQKDITPIKEKYQNDFLIGNAITSSDLEGARLELLKMHHNVVTAENAMKPSELQPTKGNFTFSGADLLVDKALAEGFDVFGHVLVWHQQSPDWMNTTTNAAGERVPLNREEALKNMQDHIKKVMEHFGDRVIGWDVVNEAMSNNPPNPTDWKASLRQSNWYHAIGPDYVEESYLAARKVLDDNGWDHIKLYYNDYNDDNQNKATAIYHMIKEINDRYAAENDGRLLIDGMGMQGHYNLSTNHENVRKSLERFITLGVEVSITELDIQAGGNHEQSERDRVAQALLYAQLFNLYKEHADSIARVTFWGLNDATSWRAATSPLLFDRNLQAKLAYEAVMDPVNFIADNPPIEIEAKQATALYGTPTIDGEIDPIWNEAERIQVNQHLAAWQGATGVARALWDSENLYVLVEVSDSELDKSSPYPWEQDSVEVFLDQTNGKTSYYEYDDGQYRVNFDNEASFNPEDASRGFESATTRTGTGYLVEMKIPLRHIDPPVDGQKLGFDVQINDARNGARQGSATWNDAIGSGYMDTSVFGELLLKKAGNEDVQEPETVENGKKPLPEQANDRAREVRNELPKQANDRAREVSNKGQGQNK
ncbi:endo-1,4-beta-xylanase A precursor [Halalkalibacter wakoensis JCM 9140]|uniref:Beta-xylanase n=1 Tax=Halalkalibacter wakoensis JCM 9140 TaxID=1236970 RepID=W4Q6N8_9BACI|nr:endo-1,4-beta-xylanase [Halalkalibacter wakoensis]GAE27358.1 endo-1,4-beta-xylanase A precursor [Halalkalibacter wakoensis JCM 9140]